MLWYGLKLIKGVYSSCLSTPVPFRHMTHVTKDMTTRRHSQAVAKLHRRCIQHFLFRFIRTNILVYNQIKGQVISYCTTEWKSLGGGVQYLPCLALLKSTNLFLIFINFCLIIVELKTKIESIIQNLKLSSAEIRKIGHNLTTAKPILSSSVMNDTFCGTKCR